MRVPTFLPVDQLVPLPADFHHRSVVHGQRHVARVMVHAFRLLEATGLHHESRRLWAAVYLHDLARTHDGRCYVHGASAAARYHKSTALKRRLAEAGVVDDDHAPIFTAVTRHSLPDELPRDHEHWTVTSLLKDADGLDRVRLSDLDPRFFRWPQSVGMIAFAERLYELSRTLPEGPGLFPALLRLVDDGPLAGESEHDEAAGPD